MIYTKEQILEKYNTLPRDVREAVFHSNLEKNITEIGEKNGLRIDQIGELLELTQFVMFGIVQSKDFIRELYERLGISDKQKVRDISHEVNLRIFQPIRESLMRIHHDGGDEYARIRNQESGIKNTDDALPSLVTKKKVMEEIEKEQPVQPAFSADKPAYSADRNQESANEPLLRRETEAENPIAEAKLSGSQKSFQTFSTYSADGDEEKPPGYTGGQDPYREPVD